MDTVTAFVKYETAAAAAKNPPKMTVTVDTESNADMSTSQVELKEIDEFETHEIFCTMKDDESMPDTPIMYVSNHDRLRVTIVTVPNPRDLCTLVNIDPFPMLGTRMIFTYIFLFKFHVSQFSNRVCLFKYFQTYRLKKFDRKTAVLQR
jgi:hypothetical protein